MPLVVANFRPFQSSRPSKFVTGEIACKGV
jgi:hypothetical protein